LLREALMFPYATNARPLDQGTPRGIARWLLDHTTKEAKNQGWDRLTSGELLNAAEQAGFDVLLTTDKNLRYQQNLTPAG
jgi:hypothetical protein